MTRAGTAVLVTTLGGVAALGHMLPSAALLGQWVPGLTATGSTFVWRGSRRPVVALTFDDGPDATHTGRVLDRLDALQLRATFFCLGERVARHPDVAREIVARGHEVGTHGHTHDSHFRHGRRWVEADLRRSLDAFAGAGLPRPRWFRPPYGHVTAATVRAARQLGLPIVLWSAMGREWAEPTGAAVAARVERAMSGGTVVLLHDAETAPGSPERVLDALAAIAGALTDRGWRAVPLGELLTAR